MDATHQISEGLRYEDIDGVVLLLDAEEAGVYSFEGEQAEVLRHIAGGRSSEELPASLQPVLERLVDAGIVAERALGRELGRRKLLMAGGVAAVSGAVLLALPGAAAAQSAGGGAGGPGGGGALAPAPPTILSGDPGPTSATITFAAGDDGGSPITNYEYSTDGGTNWTPFSPAVTTSPATITGLSGTTTIVLRAVNAIGASSPSNSVDVTPAPQSEPVPPTITDATADVDAATLTFALASDGGSAVTNYEYSTDGGTTWTAFSPAVTSSPATIASIADGDDLRLRAVNAVGTGSPSNSAVVTAGTSTKGYLSSAQSFAVPASVTGLTVDLVGGQGGDGGDDNQDVLDSNDRTGGTGGVGGRVTGRLAVIPGETLTVAPGQGGKDGDEASNSTDGGAGGDNPLSGYDGGTGGTGWDGGGGGGGGAATVLMRSSTVLAVAPGGGGGGGAEGNLAGGGNGGNGASTSARADNTSTTVGRDGESTPSSGARGAGGGGGGGDRGGERGDAAATNNDNGTGGHRGTASTVGLTSASSTNATGETGNGYATFDWLAITVA